MRESITNNDAKLSFGVIVGGAVFAVLMLNSLANWLGVNLNSALIFVLGISLTILILAVGLYCQVNDTWPLTLLNSSPLALWTFILGISPVLQKHGSIGPLFAEIYLWWGNPSFHVILAWLVLIVGYGILYIRRDH